ncbi:MAG: CPBP family intramembrane glutamic endopeptidase [Bacteroidota bacterium]
MTVPHYMQTSARQNLLYLLLLFVGGLILGALLSLLLIAGIFGKDMVNNVMLMTHTDTPGFVAAFRIFIAFGNTLSQFFFPAVFFAYVVAKEPETYLPTKTRVPLVMYLLVIGIVFSFLPVVDITSYFNQKMTLPAGFEGLDKWIHDTEKQGEKAINTVLQMKTIGDLLNGLFIVAVLPAVSEEFFFRGCMQTLFKKWTKNTHAAVWITAVIFSFMHLEFLGFVPRMLLGAVLGYLFVWSGSIWPSVLAHCLNNGISVFFMYLYQHKKISTNLDGNAPMFNQMWIYFICFAVSVVLILLYRKITLNKQLITDGEELD